LVAWHPKASEENERTTVALKIKLLVLFCIVKLLVLLARRIVNYAEEGMQVVQGTDAGFIKWF
jgi:phosphatidylserine decarboxylase